MNSLSEILADKIPVDVFAVQALSISTDSIINLRYPKFFEEGAPATDKILNYTFYPINEPKYNTTLLYARATHPNDFINQLVDTKSEAKAVVQFIPNHYTFLANDKMCHQPIIRALSHQEDGPIISEGILRI